MKYLLSCVILIIIVVFSLVKAESGDSVENDIIIMLKELDQLRNNIEISYNIDNTIAPNILAVTGRFCTMKAIMSVLGKYFSEEAALMEIQKLSLHCIDGRIGYRMSDNEDVLEISDDAQFDFVFKKNSQVIVKITSTNVDGNICSMYYFLRFINRHWFVDDEITDGELNVIKSNYEWNRSSSFLINDRTIYHTDNLFDNNPKTAWVEGVNGDGINQWVDMCFIPSRKVNKIELINGYAKSLSVYRTNNRLKKVRLTFNRKISYIFNLNDEIMGFQRLTLPKSIDVERLRLTILDVFRGNRYRDTCISEIRFN